MVDPKEKNLIEDKKCVVVKAPVIVVLGHIDHGKSSLLCAIKDFKITEKESGGITQHIGAYAIEHQGKKITFIDTPGHEAFSAMRSRGAKVADIAILVIDAEEGVKAQTKEVISHVKNLSLPVIVVINKVDKPLADPPKVKRELAREDILVETEGGKIPVVEVSAKTGQGIPDLLDLILLVAEMEGLEVNLCQSAEGVVIESYLDTQRGPTTTLLVRRGILRLGDVIGTSSTFGKVKIMEDFQGNSIKEAFPPSPVIVLGFNKVPQMGEKIQVFPDIETAQQNTQKPEKKEEMISVKSDKKVINLILKVDVSGSLEAITESLKALEQEGVEIRILRSGAGDISEEDLNRAQLAKARIVGFRVKVNPRASKLAQTQKVTIMTFDVIYDLVEAVKILVEKALKPKQELKEIGRVEVLAIFRTEKNRQIVGGKVIEGEVIQGAKIDVLSDEEKVGGGKMVSLQRDKKVIEKVKKGGECGILFEGDVKIKEGDTLVIKSYEQ